jgi:non-ribosomal peptide synthetase component F
VNVGYIGAKQTLETAMDDEVANAGKTSRANFPWLAAYPAGVPARIETPPYNVLGEIAPDLAARRPAARAFTTIMPNGMAASLTFAEVDRYSDAFAAYLRETLHLEPGARVAIQIPNGLAYPVAAFGICQSQEIIQCTCRLLMLHLQPLVFARRLHYDYDQPRCSFER